LVLVLVVAVWWTWPGGDLEAYRGQAEIAEVQNNRTERAEIEILALQPEGVRGAEEDVVVDARRVTLEPGEARGSSLLECTDDPNIASELKVVVRANRTGEDTSVVSLDPEDCEPGGGIRFWIKALPGAVGIGVIE
jgi:hypothetical protein